MVTRRCDAALGIGHGICVHSLRHTVAVNAAENGGTVGEVKRFLDHKSVRVTALYLDHIQSGGVERIGDNLADRYE